MISQEFIKNMQNRLLEEKARVENQIKIYKKPEQGIDNPDMEDIADDATEDILEEKLLDVHEDLLDRINDALLRIKDGSYGFCANCGAEMTEEELEKEPWADHCPQCKE